jgi:hypothetical protein
MVAAGTGDALPGRSVLQEVVETDRPQASRAAIAGQAGLF